MPSSPPPAGRTLPHPGRDEIRLEAVLHALSDPMRLRVVRALAAAEAEMACSEVELTVSKSTSTHHFRVLREAGVICQCYRGTAKMNGLRRDDLEALFPGLLDAVLAAAERQASPAAAGTR
ncbi:MULTISPECIES: ArsR/SmtB family transcription factor [Streptomycetaceae]|uniref:Transcription regulator ArsR n=1 Tax=Streptantibioticus cattleyicolor (strain ATCC 35852 / DSM 46488 / JCM 4925 / NBRC 14057 / NRRL 8057) TaxID=1003195 RepID=F8JW47_STREN|nr:MULTISPECIES: helix-turn-helix transcriptional regulator [Streptomycetaceae]AEW93215.1 transcription regulator ArsR [Streptantibioticus cattleyicolor NRRL 8057 = DSM 46488]MYS57939.1 helix-turn-helix domain-containing protein [Streptomyces sp. SID5468]CCB73578.1 ArsR-family transcriptional regulator [Streptantibioticus cattleyicolor NRRL 8057 = DSM 46488]